MIFSMSITGTKRHKFGGKKIAPCVQMESNVTGCHNSQLAPGLEKTIIGESGSIFKDLIKKSIRRPAAPRTKVIGETVCLSMMMPYWERQSALMHMLRTEG
jgi:hypothetical protein